MRVRRGGWMSGAVLVLAIARPVAAAEEMEVRVLSGPGPQPTSTITLRARPDVTIEDRTPGAKPATERRGPASAGETFAGEVTLFLPGFAISRPAAIEVGDPLVSAVRLFPEATGTTVTLFVRQPVTYSVSRPSAIGEIRLDLRGKARAVIVQPGVRRTGHPRIARPKVTGEPEVAVDAESLSYDQQTNTLTARGGVTLTRADTVLTADEVVYDRTNSIAEAKGHVVLSDPQATVSGDFAHLNLEDESGWVENSTANLQPSKYVLKAGRIDKLGGPLYGVRDGVFTTCECGGLERPSWSILGGKTDVTLSGAGHVRNAYFRVKDVPVLWFPWFVFPANTNRQSGFLMPRVGYSSTRGYLYQQAYYWAIDKSSDATVALDLETSARVGVIGQYRYVLSQGTHGDFTAAYYNEAIRTKATGAQTSAATVEEPENRFGLSGSHRQPFYFGSKIYGDLFAVSDNTFLRDVSGVSFGGARHDWQLRSTTYTTSQAGIYRPWSDGLVWLDDTYHQDLINPQELALQRLPRVEAEQQRALLDDRLVGRIDAEAVHYQRDTGYKGFRGDLVPELFLPFHLGRIVHGSLAGQVRETAYHLTDREQVGLVVPDFPAGVTFRRATELPKLDANRTRELAEFNGQSGAQFERVYDFHHLGLEKVKHTIEPELQYLFVPQVGRPHVTTELPPCNRIFRPVPGLNCQATIFSEGFLFDERDAINRRNFVSGGITTRLLGRGPTPAEAQAEATEKAAQKAREEGEEPPVPGAPPPTPPRGAPREILRLSLLQGYDISRSLVGNSHVSDIDALVRVNPADYLGLGFDGTLSAEDRALRGMVATMTLREPGWVARPIREYQGPSLLQIRYAFIEPNVNAEINPTAPESRVLNTTGLNEIDANLYIRLGQYAGFAFLTRYDLSTTPQPPNPPLGPHFLERDYLIRIISRCNCWIFEAGVSERINPDEAPVFRAQLTLVGLGSFGQAPAERNLFGFGTPAYRSAARAGLGGTF